VPDRDRLWLPLHFPHNLDRSLRNRYLHGRESLGFRPMVGRDSALHPLQNLEMDLLGLHHGIVGQLGLRVPSRDTCDEERGCRRELFGFARG